MISTYQNYLKEKESMEFSQMEALHQEMIKEIGADEDAQDLYRQMLRKAVDYAGIRAEWELMSREEKMDRDPLRTSAHDSLIINLTMLARYLRMQGKEAKWRDALGDEKENPYCRKAIGDFGCYLVFVNSLCAR